MTEKKSGSKLKKTVLTVIIALIAFVVLVLVAARLFFRAPVRAYYKASEKAFMILVVNPTITPGRYPPKMAMTTVPTVSR